MSFSLSKSQSAKPECDNNVTTGIGSRHHYEITSMMYIKHEYLNIS